MRDIVHSYKEEYFLTNIKETAVNALCRLSAPVCIELMATVHPGWSEIKDAATRHLRYALLSNNRSANAGTVFCAHWLPFRQ